MLFLYFKLIAASIVGLGIQLVAKNESLKRKARLSNVQYNGLGELVKDDIGSIIGTILTISLGFLIVGGGINPNRLHLPDEPIPLMWGWVVLSKRIIYEACIVILFSTLGYTGVDIALRLFSVTNKKINAAIDYKTTQADAANNTTDHPTPK